MKKIKKLLGEFAFHMWDTHGLPLELTKDEYSKMNFIMLMSWINKHKDFKFSWQVKKK